MINHAAESTVPEPVLRSIDAYLKGVFPDYRDLAVSDPTSVMVTFANGADSYTRLFPLRDLVTLTRLPSYQR